ncbi:MAG: methyltransferase domain-containing protein [Bacteroidetes bacterium]|nr:methyltransferase domain-containing protein [Bacteroidota bacterium]
MILDPLTGSPNTRIIYEQKDIPLIQNCVYPTKKLAKEAQTIDVTLAQSLDNGFVFSANFDDTIIDYDQHYQNEQSNSVFFQHHLKNVVQILKENELLNKKIVEIGCGKAYFMNMLIESGEDVTGFDPTYEGDSNKVIKDFFSEKYANIGAETIILRHTLEHISKPFHFIQTIAKANKYKGHIYIEVPTFEWIVKHKASEDVFYEHCNYFTLETLQHLFTDSVGGHFFNDQYIYVIADLSKVKKEVEPHPIKNYNIGFNEKITQYQNLISKKQNIAIWGAGAKGSTFLNLVDKDATKIACVIDINPKKQGQFIGGTGHLIIKPQDIAERNIKAIVVMNINYLSEIKAITEPLNIELLTL